MFLCGFSAASFGEVARSSAASVLAQVPGGSGLSLYFVKSDIRSFFVSLRAPVLRTNPFSEGTSPRTRRASARDGTPSFREINLRIEARLNIRAGSSRARRGTRLNRRFRETGIPNPEGPERLAELASDQHVSPGSGSTMLPPGREAPALVKSCERY